MSSLALGYSSNPTSSNRPFVHPLDLQEIQAIRRTTATTHFPTKDEAATITTRRRYDLGIGKNPPLTNNKHLRNDDPLAHTASLRQSSFEDDHMISSESTTRYLVEHHATREYPSPLQRVMVVVPKPPSQPRVLPKVQHERRVQDALQIDHPPNHSADNLLDDVSASETRPPSGTPMKPMSSVLPLIRTSSKVQLDVNTVWVEMMLHSEHMKSVSRMIPSAVVV